MSNEPDVVYVGWDGSQLVCLGSPNKKKDIGTAYIRLDAVQDLLDKHIKAVVPNGGVLNRFTFSLRLERQEALLKFRDDLRVLTAGVKP